MPADPCYHGIASLETRRFRGPLTDQCRANSSPLRTRSQIPKASFTSCGVRTPDLPDFTLSHSKSPVRASSASSTASIRARCRRVTETSSDASCSSAVRDREASRIAASMMNFGVLIPLRLAAAAMLRLVAAGIRSDVGETLVELMRYKCSAIHSTSTIVISLSVVGSVA